MPAFNGLANVVGTAAADTNNHTLLPANPNRIGGLICNDNPTARLAVKFGAGADFTINNYTLIIEPGDSYELPAPIYTGRIDGMFSQADTGRVEATEWT